MNKKMREAKSNDVHVVSEDFLEAVQQGGGGAAHKISQHSIASWGSDVSCTTHTCLPLMWYKQTLNSSPSSLWETNIFVPTFSPYLDCESDFVKSCMRSNSCISWRISFKFCMVVYLGKIYTPIVFGDAGHILVAVLCALCRPHFSTDFFFLFLLRFCMEVHHSIL